MFKPIRPRSISSRRRDEADGELVEFTYLPIKFRRSSSPVVRNSLFHYRPV
jgi:hypothetical protein